jgi:hypothetical protein
VLAFGVLSPLALYRGPLNPYGVGIGVYSVLATLHVLPPVALVAAVMAVVQVQNVCDPTNTQNVWVANFTGVGVERITRLALPYQVGVATLAVACAVAFAQPLFGLHFFRTAAAAAATIAVGAPPAHANVIAVVAADAASRSAADEIAHTIARSWPEARTIEPAPAEATECASVPYASQLRVTTAKVGSVTDVGLALADCAGWAVDQWHAQGPDPRVDALATLARLELWRDKHPDYARNVFERGIAYDPRDGAPTYFYTLFKTNDGVMHALARPDGPAWLAGLRSGDVVDKVDGHYWWEYGTYQTELKPYDGQPHTFDITRGDQHDIHVALGAPYMS